jgi:hypothetical protein
MKKVLYFFTCLGFVSLMAACSPKLKPGQLGLTYKGKAKKTAVIDSLSSLKRIYGDNNTTAEIVKALRFQDRAKLNKAYGVVIPKTLITAALNGFSDLGPNAPLDKSNYDKWDFMVAYPGIFLSRDGQEELSPAVFFFKGGAVKGKFEPVGGPVLDIKLPGGGGGDGNKPKPTDPPTTP